MNSQLLVHTIVQQTMVFIAQLATAGGVRAPLARIADQVFLDLTRELMAHGLKKKVIADMFGMGLRTYHRRVQSAEQSKSVSGRTVWEAVLDFVKQHEPVSGVRVLARFANDDPEIVSGVLNDFVSSGLAYRSGKADTAVYRLAADTDFGDAESRAEANRFLVWLAAFREGPLSVEAIAARTELSPNAVEAALGALVEAGDVKVKARSEAESTLYISERFEVPWGSARGWEAAVLDHFQAMVRAVTLKLGAGRESARLDDAVGGSTWSFDVWSGHPLEMEARTTLARLRQSVEGLRQRVDEYNARHRHQGERDRVVVYVGQYVQTQETESDSDDEE